MTVEEQKAYARIKKQSLIQKILISRPFYPPEYLEMKSLKQLQKIFNDIRKGTKTT